MTQLVVKKVSCPDRPEPSSLAFDSGAMPGNTPPKHLSRQAVPQKRTDLSWIRSACNILRTALATPKELPSFWTPDQPDPDQSFHLLGDAIAETQFNAVDRTPLESKSGEVGDSSMIGSGLSFGQPSSSGPATLPSFGEENTSNSESEIVSVENNDSEDALSESEEVEFHDAEEPAMDNDITNLKPVQVFDFGSNDNTEEENDMEMNEDEEDEEDEEEDEEEYEQEDEYDDDDDHDQEDEDEDEDGNVVFDHEPAITVDNNDLFFQESNVSQTQVHDVVDLSDGSDMDPEIEDDLPDKLFNGMDTEEPIPTNESLDDAFGLEQLQDQDDVSIIEANEDIEMDFAAFDDITENPEMQLNPTELASIEQLVAETIDSSALPQSNDIVVESDVAAVDLAPVFDIVNTESDLQPIENSPPLPLVIANDPEPTNPVEKQTPLVQSPIPDFSKVFPSIGIEYAATAPQKDLPAELPSPLLQNYVVDEDVVAKIESAQVQEMTNIDADVTELPKAKYEEFDGVNELFHMGFSFRPTDSAEKELACESPVEVHPIVQINPENTSAILDATRKLLSQSRLFGGIHTPPAPLPPVDKSVSESTIKLFAESSLFGGAPKKVTKREAVNGTPSSTHTVSKKASAVEAETLEAPSPVIRTRSMEHGIHPDDDKMELDQIPPKIKNVDTPSVSQKDLSDNKSTHSSSKKRSRAQPISNAEDTPTAKKPRKTRQSLANGSSVEEKTITTRSSKTPKKDTKNTGTEDQEEPVKSPEEKSNGIKHSIAKTPRTPKKSKSSAKAGSTPKSKYGKRTLRNGKQLPDP